MTQVKSPHLALAESFCSRTEVPTASVVALKVAHMFVVWSERARSRRVLETLNSHQLDDIGITPAEARQEFSKPFWRP